MKVALFTCPNPQLESPTAHFPIGLLYVGKSLLDAGHDVSIVDLRSRKLITKNDIPDVDIVGVTSTSGEIHYAKKIARLARGKGILTMVGGAHATFMPDDCSTDFDFVILGDGEVAVTYALSHGPGKYCKPLETISGYSPDWNLIGNNGFSSELFTGAGYGEGPLAAGITASRGCPYKCSYCRSKVNQVRYRLVNEVGTEITKLVIGYGIRYYRFYDDCLTLNRERSLELFNLLRKLHIHWRAHTRSNLWTDELAREARKSGCDEMGFGFEAVTDSVLKKVRKQETVDQHREAVKVCKRNSVICKAFWMVGLPGQGWDEIEDIKKFMLKEKPDKWIVSLFSPYPGSDVYAHPDNYGVSWIDPDLSNYWNFPNSPTIAYHDNPASEIQKQYIHLKSWLEDNFGRF